MKPRVMVWFPPLFAAAFVAIGLSLGPGASDAVRTVLRIENEVGKVLCVLGMFAAACAFERGDYLRRAWAYSGGCMLLLLLRDVTVIPSIDALLGGDRFDSARTALVVAANTSSVIGVGMLARAWTVSGLDDDAAKRRRWPMLAVGIVVALAVTGWPLSKDLTDLAHGRLGAIAWLASDLGDTLCMVLFAPLLHTALALRGGRLLWPWGLLTAAGVCWILYDAAWGIGELRAVDKVLPVQIGVEALRGLACTLSAIAGLAQRWAVRQNA
jgi:hypothetical protein